MTALPLKNGFCDSFLSLRALCRQIGIEQADFLRLAQDAEQHYKLGSERIGTKVRELSKPSRELKKLQKGINRFLFRRFEWPDYLQGSIRKRSARTNAEAHAGASCLVKVDVRDYFPSISCHHVNRAWQQMGFSTSIARYLTKLTTHQGVLPQGAPTSGPIANLILMPEEAPLVKRVEKDGHVYTRYVDDIAISGPNARRYTQDAIRVIQKYGFRIERKKKLKIESKNVRMELTGFHLNDGRPTIGKKYRDQIRLRVFKVEGLSGLERIAEIKSILGCITHVSGTNKNAGNRLLTLLESRVATEEIERARKTSVKKKRW